MAPVFPLSKLAFLFVKQVAKPLASTIKKNAVKSALFRERICLPPARFYHWCEVRMKMYVMNIGRSKNTNIPKLNEEAAIELGANLIGEGMIFSIAAIILTVEVVRSKEKDKSKEEDAQNYLDNLENRINELEYNNEELDTKIRELTRLCYSLQGKIRHTPNEPTKDAASAQNNTIVVEKGTIIKAIDDATAKISKK